MNDKNKKEIILPDGFKEKDGCIINDKGQIIFDCVDYESDPYGCLDLLKTKKLTK